MHSLTAQLQSSQSVSHRHSTLAQFKMQKKHNRNNKLSLVSTTFVCFRLHYWCFCIVTPIKLINYYASLLLLLDGMANTWA